MLYASIYVDDLIFTRNCQQMFEDFREAMKQQFEMPNFGLMSYSFGIEVQQGDDGILLELWLTIGMVATLLERWLHYWNGGYTIGMVATLLERWLHY